MVSSVPGVFGRCADFGVSGFGWMAAFRLDVFYAEVLIPEPRGARDGGTVHLEKSLIPARLFVIDNSAAMQALDVGGSEPLRYRGGKKNRRCDVRGKRR